MSQQAMEVFQDIRSVEQQRVLWSLLAQLDFENLIQVNQTEIAQKLKMHRSHVSRAMKALRDRGVILEGPKIGRSATYRLNPQMGWKGSAKNHDKVMRERMAKAGITGVITSPGDAAPEPDSHQALEDAGQMNLFPE